MEKLILGAALCCVPIALAGAAHADSSSDFLAGSTNALILGPTGVSTPDAAYISDVENLYLDPNGYDGTPATTLALTTPESVDFGNSVAQGENDLVNAVVADYNAGDMHCAASGVCSDPLTIFTYSQSSVIASLAEQQLAADQIPSDALRFVMIGDTASAQDGFLSTLGDNPWGQIILDSLGWQNLIGSTTPDNLYPTEVYTIAGDLWADPFDAGGLQGTLQQDIELGSALHEAYLGLTPAEIGSATPVVEGLTTYFDIPTLNVFELWGALFNAFSAL
jgi:PE-PPE domain-containing protein